ncbi:MAG: hypothetical protein ACXVXU_17030, partial [Blastococcus sp.]
MELVATRGRPKTAPIQACPQHPGSLVASFGLLTTTTGVRRRYRCLSRGEDRHIFSVSLSGQEPVRDPRPRTTPPECAEHADADHSVIRFGRYGRSTPQPRQRYQCRRKKLDKNGQSVLDDDGRPELIKHVFT